MSFRILGPDSDLSVPIERAARRVHNAFPDLGPFDVQLVVSGLTFDARTGLVDDRRTVFVGIDTLAASPDVNLDVLFTHEITHIYHRQVAPETFAEYVVPYQSAPLYRILWTEGLATWISQLLCPQASLADVLMSRQLAADGPPRLVEAANECRRHGDAAAVEMARRYFSGTSPADLPARMGYLVGTRVAEQIAAQVPMAELPHLKDPGLRERIRAALSRLSATRPTSETGS